MGRIGGLLRASDDKMSSDINAVPFDRMKDMVDKGDVMYFARQVKALPDLEIARPTELAS